MPEGIQENLAVRVILEKNTLLLVPVRGQVIDCAGVFDAERAERRRILTAVIALLDADGRHHASIGLVGRQVGLRHCLCRAPCDNPAGNFGLRNKRPPSTAGLLSLSPEALVYLRAYIKGLLFSFLQPYFQCCYFRVIRK